MNLEDTLQAIYNPTKPWPFSKEYFANTLRNGTDIMIVDVNDARQYAKELRTAFQEVFRDRLRTEDIRFATKAAPCGEILHAMHDLGLGLEVASEAEIKMAQKLYKTGKDIVFSNPGKHLKTAKAALKAGIRLFVTDSVDDLNTLRTAAKETGIDANEIEIIVRLQQPQARKGVDSCGSHLGLPVQDETQPIDALRLAKKAADAEYGFKIVGTTFNAGTNLHEVERWQGFINESARFAKLAKEAGLNDVSILDMGGSFPARTSSDVLPIKKFAKDLYKFIDGAYKGNKLEFPRVIIEPGRSIAHSAYLFSTVISKKPNLAKGPDEDDFHLVTTAGHYNSGLRVALADYDGKDPDKAGFGMRAFRLDTDNTLKTIPGGKARYTTEGLVTADVAKYGAHASLPKDLQQGDVMCFSEVGAYSRSFITHWLGFEMPEMVIFDSHNPRYKRHISNFNPTMEIEWAGAERLGDGYSAKATANDKYVPRLADMTVKMVLSFMGYQEKPHTVLAADGSQAAQPKDPAEEILRSVANHIISGAYKNDSHKAALAV